VNALTTEPHAGLKCRLKDWLAGLKYTFDLCKIDSFNDDIKIFPKLNAPLKKMYS